MGKDGFRLTQLNEELQSAITRIGIEVRRRCGRAFLVAGTARDLALGLTPRIIHIQICGLDAKDALHVLSSACQLEVDARARPLLEIKGLPIDVSVLDREPSVRSAQPGPHGPSSPGLLPDLVGKAVDFTINAMALDPLTGELIDPYGGLRDLRARVLRHTHDHGRPDPILALRGMALVAQFDLEARPATLLLCQKLSAEDTEPGLAMKAWQDLILLGSNPSRGLNFLRRCGWLRIYPELEALIDCVQEPSWHPEGDVWTHTLLGLDAYASERVGIESDDLVVGLAVLCHDLGKPATTKFFDGRIRSYGHEEGGEGPTRSFLKRLDAPTELVEEVVPLVTHHLKPSHLFASRASGTAVRRLAHRVGRIDRLVRVAKADRTSTGLVGYPAGDWIMERAQEVPEQGRETLEPAPLIMGRHLVDLGLTPGPHFSPILDACYKAQQEGLFDTVEGGLNHARRILKDMTSPRS